MFFDGGIAGLVHRSHTGAVMSTWEALDVNFHRDWTNAGSEIVQATLYIDTVPVHIDPNPIGKIVGIREGSRKTNDSGRLEVAALAVRAIQALLFLLDEFRYEPCPTDDSLQDGTSLFAEQMNLVNDEKSNVLDKLFSCARWAFRKFFALATAPSASDEVPFFGSTDKDICLVQSPCIMMRIAG